MKKLGFFLLLLGAFFLASFSRAPEAFAGTDLTVNCTSVGACSVSPTSTPLLSEFGWMPGSTATQYFRMSNNTNLDGFSAIEVVNYSNEVNDLGEIVEIEIRRGSPVGTVIYGGVTLHQFRDDGYFTIDTLNDNLTEDYFVLVSMPASAGNKYQGAGVLFDLNMGLELEAIPPDSGGGDGEGSVLGAASPPVCHDDKPEGQPLLTVSNTGANTVSLSWTAVTPVSHYALIFTRDRDGAQYGSTNIGNVTSYVVSRLSGNESYSFEIIPINGCAPGDRSISASTGTISGAVLSPETRPLGPDGEVLGTDTDGLGEDEEGAVGGVIDNGNSEGEVLGDAICEEFKNFVPWVLLIIQAVISFAIYYINRNKIRSSKQFSVIIATALSILVFYLLRSCDCANLSQLLLWLCQYYWIVALAEFVFMFFVDKLFVESVE